MPKTFYKRTKVTRKNTVRPRIKNSDVVKVDRKVEALKKTVKGASDIRFKDFFQGGGTVTNTASFFLLNGMSTGDTNGTREGTSALFKKIRIVMNIVAGDPTNLFRLMLVLDKQPGGTTPLITELLDTSLISPQVLAYRTDGNKARFTVFYDRLHSLIQGGDTNQLVIKMAESVNFRTDYLSTGGGIADIGRNALYLVMVSDSAAATHPSFNVGARMRYSP